jgi:hypothetical protein
MDRLIMTLPLLDGALFVSSSFLDVLTCPRAAEYYKLHGKVAERGTSAITFGQHIHSALSLYYRLQEYNLSPDEIKTKVSTLLEQQFTLHPVDEDDWRNLNWAMETIQRLISKYEFEDIEVVRYKEPRKCKYCKPPEPCLWCNNTGLTSVMSEIPFVVKLFDYQQFFSFGPHDGKGYTNIPIYYHGFIDLLIRRSNLLYVMDFKSTSQLGTSYWDDKKAIAQPKGYAWALQELLGVKIHGYLIRAIRTIPPPKYVTEGTPNKKGEYKKVESWWDESLCEQSFELGPGELEEWKENTIAQVKTFLHFYQEGYFPQQKSMCVGKYGKCQYYEVCSTFPISDRQKLLNSAEFKDKEQNMNLIK